MILILLKVQQVIQSAGTMDPDLTDFSYRITLDNLFLTISGRVPDSVDENNIAVYTIEADYDERPDLLAHKLYETSELWWVFATRNPDIIVDPIRDFRTGVTIAIPSAESVLRATGG